MSKADATESIAVGENAHAKGAGAIALGGSFTEASAAEALAIDAIAIGRDADVSETSVGSIAIGNKAKANALDTVALGQSATASAQYASAFGDSASASAVSATAVGYLATASGLHSTSVGTESDATGTESVALGEFAQATAAGAVALGAGPSAVGAARANAVDSIAIGRAAGVGAANTSGIALGRGATVNGAFGIAQGDGVVSGATGRNVAIGSTGTTANSSTAIGGAVAIGRAQTANGNGAVAIGDPNTATGTGAVAVGADNTANGQGAVALGNLNTATGQGSVALGNASSAGAAGAVAIGDGASAGIARSVALGSGSAAAAAVGTASTVIRGTTYNFAGTAPTSTVSVGTAGAERTVTNVAAGRLSGTSTDAVNGSQLFATNQAVQAAGAGFSLTAQGANGSNVDPSEAVDLRNTDGNIAVSKVAGDNNVNFDLADDITVNSVTAGNSRLDNTGLVISGGPSVTAAGINAGGQVISNVAAGVAATDGVNKSQLDAVGATANAGFNVSAQGANSTNVAPGQTVDLNNTDGNIVVSKTGADDNVAFDLADDITVNSVTAGATTLNSTGLTITGGPSVTAAGINAGNQVISNVAAGVAGTDGVNKSQLDAVGATANAGFNVSAQGANSTNVAPGQTIDLNNTDGNIVVSKTGADDNVSFELADDITVNSVTAGATTLNSTGLTITGGPSVTAAGINAGGQVITNVAAGVAATDGVNKSQLDAVGATANAGFNVSAQGANATNVAPGETVDLNNTDGNIVVSKTGADDNVSFDLADDITVNSVTAGATTLNSTGLTIAGGPSVTAAGINAGGQVITNVAAGVAATDGVNKSQLDAVGATANAGFNVSAQGANSTNVAPGETVDFNNTDGNIVVSKTGADDNVAFDLADDITVNSVTAGATTLNNTGLTIAGGPSVTSAGINAGGQVITNVAAGVAGTDGVNKSQLDAVAGGSTSLGLNFTGNDNAAGDVHRDLGQTLSIRGDATAAGSYSGGNIKTVTDPTTGAINVQLADAPKFGNVVVNDGGSGKISGVTAADLSAASTEAVNGSQLFQTNQDVAALGTRVTTNEGDIAALNNVVGPTDQAYQDANGHGVRYVRTNDTGLPESDAFATGANSTAIGYNAQASAEETLAIGENSVANQLSATAIGSGAQSTGEYAIALGDNARASGRHSLAVGDEATASGVFATSVGVLSDASGDFSSALGIEAKASGRRSLALGHFAASSAELAIAIGADSQASHAGSVALGANAVANGATLGTAAYVPPASTYAVAGTAPVGEVSVGAAGAERRLTNVAAGAVDTDAANISQLKAVDSKITSLGQDSLLWDPTANGGAGAYNANHLGTGPNKIVNVAPADLSAASTDAVNGSQLFQTNQDVAALDSRVTTNEGDIANLDNRVTTNEGDITNIKNQMGPTDPAYLQQNGRGTRYARTNDTGLAEDDAHAQGVGSTAVGYNATSSAADAVAIGRGSQASHAGSVALGAGSVANGSTLGNAAYLVGGTATGEVNVGNRRVTGVAAGSEDTDAANVGQLKAVATSATQAEQRSVKYDWNDLDADGEIDPGEVDYSKATLAGPTSTDGGVTGGSKITNLAQGEVSATSTDAVNGAQLYNVAGPNDATYISQNGRGTRYARTNDTGLAEADAHAQAVGSSAVGYNATASAGNAVAVGRDSVAGHANSVALGAGSSTTAGAQSGYNAAYVGSSNSTGQVQVGGRTIGGVAAGSAADDAVNVGQLQAGVNDAVTQANAYTDTRVDQIAGNVAQYDNRISTVEGDVNSVKNGSAGLFQVSQDNTAAPTVSGANASAGGAGAVASGTGSTALGNGAIASANNAVALGAGSVANQEGTVSVGSAGNERRVSNVAAGTSDTDAVNVAQLKGFTTGGLQYDKNADGSNNTNSVTFNPNGSGETTLRNVAAGKAPTDAVNVSQLGQAVTTANSYTDSQVATVRNDVWKLGDDVRRLERNMHSGIATAIAIKPAPYVAGRTTYYAGFGAYKSEAAFGVSLRHTADNGRWSLEGGASSNSDGIGAYIGVSGVLGD
ncbi:hemagglutinin family protein [Lysobacter antibioticus]|nr:hemagglutinin family protein [Lysobacter antibioticus]